MASPSPEATSGQVAVSIIQEAGVNGLQPLPRDKELTVTFTSVNVWVPKSFGPPSTLPSLRSVKSLASLPTQKKLGAAEAAAKEDMRQVLFSVTGSVRPGELLALMGPSGGGKTTLLSILGGRTPKAAKMDGSVLFNGVPLNKRAKRQTGYVMQDDLLYEALTVFETLYFAAMLRLPSHMTKAQKVERVENVIQALGLSRCRDTIIGGFFRRGVSGGERKRVSVGHELLINPSVLLLDEPTSGLDSTTARNLLQLLRELASSGRAVITTIHQPSSRLYQQLDTVLLLSQGHMIYYGQGSAAAEWFGQLGVPLPYGVNVADFILDIASGEAQGETRSGEAARTWLIEYSESYLASHPEGYRQKQKLEVPDSSSEHSGSEEEGKLFGQSSKEGTRDYEHQQQQLHDEEMGALAVEQQQQGQQGSGSRKRGVLTRSATSFSVGQPGASRWGASYWTQIQILFIRAVRTRRFETLSKQDFAQFIIVGAICGMIWWQVGQNDTLSAAENTMGLLFFESLFLSFRVLFTALFTFPNELKMLLKERASGMYRLSAFYIARTTSDLPMDCTVPTVFIILIYFTSGLRLGAQWFFANWAAIMLVSLVAQSVGLLIGATVTFPKTAQTIAAVVMLGFMLVGGFYVRNIPDWIGWLKWVSFMTYGYNLVLRIEFGGRQLYNCGTDYNPSNPATDPACTPVADMQEALKMTVDPNGPAWEVPVLLGMLLVLRLCVYIALRRKTAAR